MRKLNQTASESDSRLIYDLRHPSPIKTPDIHALIRLHRLRDVDYPQQSQLENASQVTDASIKETHGKKYDPTLRLIKILLIMKCEILHAVTFKSGFKRKQSHVIKKKTSLTCIQHQNHNYFYHRKRLNEQVRKQE